MKDKSFKAFKEYLNIKCWSEKDYGEGKYDRRIYNWFRLGKPVKLHFITKQGKKVYFKGRKSF